MPSFYFREVSGPIWTALMCFLVTLIGFDLRLVF